MFEDWGAAVRRALGARVSSIYEEPGIVIGMGEQRGLGHSHLLEPAWESPSRWGSTSVPGAPAGPGVFPSSTGLLP